MEFVCCFKKGAFFIVTPFNLVTILGCLECKFNLLFATITFDKRTMRSSWI